MLHKYCYGPFLSFLRILCMGIGLAAGIFFFINYEAMVFVVIENDTFVVFLNMPLKHMCSLKLGAKMW